MVSDWMRMRNEIKETTAKIFAYHQRTKHHYHAYARSLGYLDWENQPDPFRRYSGAEKILLPFRDPTQDGLPYDRLYDSTVCAQSEVNRVSIGHFFQFALGLSAWKKFQGSRWALRMNPSSGNLHPTEGYAILPVDVLEGPAKGGIVGHYLSEDHSLEIRTSFEQSVGIELMKSFPEGSFLVGLSSIHWREAWKYGERAYRYCQHDVGHAFAAMVLSARMLGWSLVHLENVSDDEISTLLGINRKDGYHPMEVEAPDLLAVVLPERVPKNLPPSLSRDAINEIGKGEWFGTANRLSEEHYDWPVIEEVHRAVNKPSTTLPLLTPPFPPQAGESIDSSKISHDIVAQRRSAVAMDGKTLLDREVFYQMMDRVMPRKENPVWESAMWPPCIHLCLFVHHRLRGMVPGLYMLIRRPDMFETFRGTLREGFIWERPEGCPEELPLFHLMEGDCRQIAGQVSCGQSIAAEGVFSLGMIADFERSIEEFGPWHYRRLFWETGMIGQVLYLEAEAAGIRSTGIGCFFDDPVHEVFGFTDRRFQSLYHFTVGGAVDDNRLQTQPPYPPERTFES